MINAVFNVGHWYLQLFKVAIALPSTISFRLIGNLRGPMT